MRAKASIPSVHAIVNLLARAVEACGAQGCVCTKGRLLCIKGLVRLWCALEEHVARLAGVVHVIVNVLGRRLRGRGFWHLERLGLGGRHVLRRVEGVQILLLGLRFVVNLHRVAANPNGARLVSTAAGLAGKPIVLQLVGLLVLQERTQPVLGLGHAVHKHNQANDEQHNGDNNGSHNGAVVAAGRLVRSLCCGRRDVWRGGRCRCGRRGCDDWAVVQHERGPSNGAAKDAVVIERRGRAQVGQQHALSHHKLKHGCQRVGPVTLGAHGEEHVCAVVRITRARAPRP